MYAFVDAHRATYGVEPICRTLAIAPSGYFAHRAAAADPTRRAARTQRDAQLAPRLRQLWHDERRVYGARASSGGPCSAWASPWRAARWSA